MGFLGNIFGGSTNQAGAPLMANAQANNGLITAGEEGALGQYANNYYTPYSQTGAQANQMYANALGLNGPQGNAAATSAFQTDPGYQFALQQGTQALDRSAAGSGMFGSGNAAEALTNYGQGMANQQYGNWLSNLSGLNNQGLTAAMGQTQRQGAMAGINEWGAGQQVANNNNAVNGYVGAQNQTAAANAQGGQNLLETLFGGSNLTAKVAPGIGNAIGGVGNWLSGGLNGLGASLAGM
jgi:hypothetical protein